MTVERLNDALLLMEDCGKVYKMAGGSERRCINQALFNKILAGSDGALKVDYAGPFASLLNPDIFILKNAFEKSCREMSNEQPDTTAHLITADFLKTLRTQTHAKIAKIFNAGLNMDCLCIDVTFDTIYANAPIINDLSNITRLHFLSVILA